MSVLVIEHVKVSELPEPWRAQLAAAGNTRVTVHIEEEAGEEEHVESAFGMWDDRQHLADVAGMCVRSARPASPASERRGAGRYSSKPGWIPHP